MVYQQLDMESDVIRLIGILPSTDQPDRLDPVCCTLEHVSLDGQHFSKDYRTWISALGRPLQSTDRSTWRADAIINDNETTEAKLALEGFKSILEEPDLGPRENTRGSKYRYIWGDYMALSYTWGNPHDTCEIFVNGQSFQATKNLERALRAIRGHEVIRAGYKLWIDAICIDQNNNAERSWMVKRMQEIYGTALDVIVWLGDEADDSNMALDFINSLSGFWDIGHDGQLKNVLRQQLAVCNVRIWEALSHLTSRRYWNRLWVIQEQIMGTKKMLILCGNRTVHWDDVYHTLYYFNNPSKDRITSIIDQVFEERDSVSEGLRQGRVYWSWNNVVEIQALRDKQPPPDAMVWTTFSRHKSANNPRDMIYGLLALIEPSVLARIKPDYDLPVLDVFAAFAKDWISGTNSLEILGHCDARNMPSWSPDWTIPSFRCVCSALEPRYHASGDSAAEVQFSADGNRLTCKGLKIDTVDGLSISFLLDEERSPLERKNSMFQSANRSNAYGNEDALKDALWKTLVGTRDLTGNTAPEDYKCLLDGFSSENFTMEKFYSPNAAFMIGGQRLESYFRRNKTNLNTDAMERAERFGWSRRLITTTNGFVGIAPEPSQPGDLVCVMLGCSVPIVLRPQKELYTVVGSCYVHGLMEGEAIEWQRTGEREFEDITLG